MAGPFFRRSEGWIVSPMARYHWKPFPFHCTQWWRWSLLYIHAYIHWQWCLWKSMTFHDGPKYYEYSEKKDVTIKKHSLTPHERWFCIVFFLRGNIIMRQEICKSAMPHPSHHPKPPSRRWYIFFAADIALNLDVGAQFHVISIIWCSCLCCCRLTLLALQVL